MRRWNGWGEDALYYGLPANAVQFLLDKIGAPTPVPDADLETILKTIPSSRLPDHPLLLQSPQQRLTHARGQSLPDWIALRSGRIAAFPDGVAYPEKKEDVEDILDYAKNAGAAVIPYGGGTSVVGHINPEKDGRPVLTVDMGRMRRLLDLNVRSHKATLEAGAAGPDVESQLRAQGYTLGHFPQSFEYSTLGGWVATRSSGQQSMHYGRIEHLFAGGRLATPSGTLEIPAFPASAAGPDLREIVLGSEGRMGLLTEIKVRVRPLAEKERFYGVFYPEWDEAMEAVRKAVQERVSFSMLRLSSPVETVTQLALAGHRRLMGPYEKMLSWQGAGKDKCMLVFGVTGNRAQCRTVKRAASYFFKGAKGFFAGGYLGKKWKESRFRTPYLRNTLWEKGYAVDTLETATDWQNVDRMKGAIETALRRSLAEKKEKIHVFTHLSHLYTQGASLYTTVIFRLAKTPDETFSRWQALKIAASEANVAQGGTISHQHGVGQDHAPYLDAEKGKLGINMIDAVFKTFDPDGMMNPGKLIPYER